MIRHARMHRDWRAWIGDMVILTVLGLMLGSGVGLFARSLPTTPTVTVSTCTDRTQRCTCIAC